MKSSSLACAFLAAILAGCGNKDDAPPPPPSPSPITIGFSMGGVRMERWKKDEKILIDRARSMGVQVISLMAVENPDLQNDQAENLIVQGVDVLLVLPKDSEKSARIVEMAHKANVPVIAYDRIILDSPLDYYVTFDNEKVGEYQARGVVDALPPDARPARIAYVGGSPADNNSVLLKRGSMRVLAPLVDSGAVSIVLETSTKDWSAQNAYLDFKAFLDAGGRADGVVAANDATASGVVQALAECGIQGVPVSGQDAELTACQRVARGTQALTVYKPLAKLGEVAVDLAVRVARGLPVKTNASIHNRHRDVPSIFLESIPVTRDNLADTVVRDGFHSFEDVFGYKPRSP